MQFLLKPPPDSGLEPISIERRLFPIGRRETPFNAYPKSAVAKLSKRHARLFVENTSVYVVDLGSLNGSTRNGQAIKDAPEALATGDILTFGGLTYEFELLAPPGPPSAAELRLRLVLKPASEDSLLQPVVISNFPFLFNKYSDLFARYASEAPEPLAYLSRNHAHIIRLADEFHIEDLGSTNGTFVNGEPIEEHIRQLLEGDVIGLGGDVLQYRVLVTDANTTTSARRSIAHDATVLVDAAEGVEPEEQGEPDVVSQANPDSASAPSPEVSEVLDSSRTIFVDSATSFIDVYFNEQPADAPAEQAPVKPANPAMDGQQSVGGAIASTLFGESLNVTRLVGGMVLALGAVGVVLGYQYWRDMHWQSLEQLQAQGAYADALARANDRLATHPADERLQEFATDAMLQTLMQPWVEAYIGGDVDTALNLVAEAQRSGSNNRDDDPLLVLLRWAAQVKGFLAARDARSRATASGADPFADAVRVGDLLTVWTEDANQRAREMRRLQDAHPAFESVHADVFANLRRLRNLELDAELVRALEANLDDSLSAGDSKRVRTEINTLLERHGELFGAELIRLELLAYEELQAAIAEKRWLDAYAMSSSTGFSTAPFKRYAQSLVGKTLPDENFMQRYSDALGLWRDGEFEASRGALQALAAAGWPEVVKQRLAYQAEQRSRWQDLQSQRDSADYARRLFDFYAELDPVEDQGLIAELRPEFVAHSREALAEATASFVSAERDWQRYRDAGGIQTEHRLDGEISAAYAERAGLLQRSFDGFSRGLQIYRQLSIKPSAAWSALRADLLREVAVQRSALRNLQVLAPSVRDGKLALLPEV